MSCGNLYIGETITVIIVILFLALNRDIHKFFFSNYICGNKDLYYI